MRSDCQSFSLKSLILNDKHIDDLLFENLLFYLINSYILIEKGAIAIGYTECKASPVMRTTLQEE